MFEMNRRQFVTRTAGLFAAGIAGRALAQTTAPATSQPADGPLSATLTIDANSDGPVVPETFTGLSYELAQLIDPNFFAATNTQLIALFKLLSPKGILRLGGNSSETCWLKVDASTTAPEPPKAKPGEDHWMPTELFEIAPVAVDHLGEFLKASGWQLIYGLNFGHSSPERLAKEAEYVASKCGDSLLYFQIGNEPDFYSAANNKTRPSNWKFNDYITEWLACAEAITAKVPNAKFGGPDVGASSNWITQFIPAAKAKLGDRVVAASGHYYVMGPPDDPRVTIARLLRTNAGVGRGAKQVSDLAKQNGLTYHMTEGNTCYRGGKPGMSDAFASALWAGDYMLTLMANGCAGVNLHGGSRNMLRASIGNHMPGEKVAAAASSDSKGGYYTPIAGELDQGFKARPIFYGMLLAQQFAGARMKPAVTNLGGIDANAYVGEKNNRTLVAVFNKSPEKDLAISVPAPADTRIASLWRLTGPALDATSGVTLARAEVAADGTWSPTLVESPVLDAGKARIDVPRNSAVLLLLDA